MRCMNKALFFSRRNGVSDNDTEAKSQPLRYWNPNRTFCKQNYTLSNRLKLEFLFFLNEKDEI